MEWREGHRVDGRDLVSGERGDAMSAASDIIPRREEAAASHQLRQRRATWRAAKGRVLCPVVREFCEHFALPMPDEEEQRFRCLLAALAVDRAPCTVEWERAAFLGDQAVRVLAPIHLEVLGHSDHAAMLRAMAPLRTPYDFFAMDRVFAQRPWERLSQAARSAATWASALGDAPAPAQRYERVFAARAAGEAMQAAQAWPQGIDALRQVARIVAPPKGAGGR